MHIHSYLLPRLALLALLASGAVGCAAGREYVYSPYGASQWRDGYQTVVVNVPPEAPTGTVEVSSFGITELAATSAAPMDALHVRMAVTNSSDAVAWTVDTDDAMIEIPGEGKTRALFVNSDLPAMPSAVVAHRERRTFDFYFALPVGIDEEEELRRFDFLWRVTTRARPFEWRTSFTRSELVPVPVHQEVVLVAGWGPHWWYNPLYPWPVYRHHPRILMPRWPGRVIVTRPPRGQRPPPPPRR